MHYFLRVIQALATWAVLLTVGVKLLNYFKERRIYTWINYRTLWKMRNGIDTMMTEWIRKKLTVNFKTAETKRKSSCA